MGTVIRFAALGAAGVPRPAQSHSTLYRSTGPVDDAAFQPTAGFTRRPMLGLVEVDPLRYVPVDRVLLRAPC